MAGFLKVEIEKKNDTKAINTKINAEILTNFQKKLKQQNIPMNVVLTVFADQYSKGRYNFDREDVLKWKYNNAKVAVLNTPVDKEIYLKFKDKVKTDGYFVKHILSAFIEDYANNDLVMAFVTRNNKWVD